jgi:NCAIR mutase (PurE)-related protein
VAGGPAPGFDDHGFEDLGFARVDHDRLRRRGYPEAIFGRGKSPRQIVAIGESLVRSGATDVLVTGANIEAMRSVAERFPDAILVPEAHLCILNPTARAGIGRVTVAAWRPEDRPVAEEAAWTAQAMGSLVVRRFEAPLHAPERMPEWFATIEQSRVIVVAEGGGGAMASVVAGLASCVVIALPTSAGPAWHGVPALLAALNSCVPGVLTVNVDNGFGAGYAAHVINQLPEPDQRHDVRHVMAGVPRGGHGP